MNKPNKVSVSILLLLVVVVNCTLESQDEKRKEGLSFADIVNTIEPLPGIVDSDDGKQLEYGIDSLYNIIISYGERYV